MFPIIMKLSNLNWEMDRCPINLTEKSKKNKVHCFLAIKENHVLISCKGDVVVSMMN